MDKIIRFDSGKKLSVKEHVALGAQCKRILEFLFDEEWHSINNIAKETHTKITSADAQVRNLRKAKHGGFKVEYASKYGLAHYRLSIDKS